MKSDDDDSMRKDLVRAPWLDPEDGSNDGEGREDEEAGAPPGRDGEPYRVGYGRPPKETQFRPGQSGNPSGRPKGRKSIGAVCERELKRKVTDSNGHSIAVQEVLIRNALMKAAKNGDMKAAQPIIAYAEAAEAKASAKEKKAMRTILEINFVDPKDLRQRLAAGGTPFIETDYSEASKEE